MIIDLKLYKGDLVQIGAGHITSGKTGTVSEYDPSDGKYAVNFKGGWIGYYPRLDLLKK